MGVALQLPVLLFHAPLHFHEVRHAFRHFFSSAPSDVAFLLSSIFWMWFSMIRSIFLLLLKQKNINTYKNCSHFCNKLAYNNSTIKYIQNKGCQIKINFLRVILSDKKHFSHAFERKQKIVELFFNNSSLK